MDHSLYLQVTEFLSTGTVPTVFPSTQSNFVAMCKKFSLNRKGRLVRDGRIVLKDTEIEETFHQLHQHTGRNKTYQKFRERFWFPSMSVWVAEKVRQCVPCANKNNSQWPAVRSPLIPIPVEPKLWWRVHLDLIGPLPRSDSGNAYIGIGVCALCKYIEGKGNDNYFLNVSFIIFLSLYQGSLNNYIKLV